MSTIQESATFKVTKIDPVTLKPVTVDMTFDEYEAHNGYRCQCCDRLPDQCKWDLLSDLT